VSFDRTVNSHAMKTMLNHPVPFAGGKHYCKLLPLSRALDYFYTTSIKPNPYRSFQAKDALGIERLDNRTQDRIDGDVSK